MELFRPSNEAESVIVVLSSQVVYAMMSWNVENLLVKIKVGGGSR